MKERQLEEEAAEQQRLKDEAVQLLAIAAEAEALRERREALEQEQADERARLEREKTAQEESARAEEIEAERKAEIRRQRIEGHWKKMDKSDAIVPVENPAPDAVVAVGSSSPDRGEGGNGGGGGFFLTQSNPLESDGEDEDGEGGDAAGGFFLTQTDPLAITSTRPDDDSLEPLARQQQRAAQRRVSRLDHTHAHTYEYGDLERVMNSALSADDLGESQVAGKE